MTGERTQHGPYRITRGPYADLPPAEQQHVILSANRMTHTIADETLLTAYSLSLTYVAGQIEIRTDPPHSRLTNECEHCHRSDVEEEVAYSWDEAVGFGWLIPIEATS